MLRHELTQHLGVLIGDRAPELRQHAGRQAQARCDRVEVARARARARPDQHLVRLARGDDLIDERIDGRAAAIDDALPANLDHVCVRQDSKIRRRVRLRLKVGVGKRSLHQERFKLRRGAGHGILPLAA